MSKMTHTEGVNVFGALKLIEQLYLDGEIPGHVFRNIIKEHGDSFLVTDFNCCKKDEPPGEEGDKICTG